MILSPVIKWTRPGVRGDRDLAVALVAFVFFILLGVLIVLYVMHFRRRALSMGDERLRAALSRTVCGEEEAGEPELRQGILELEKRLQRALYAVGGILIVVLSVSLVLTIRSDLPELSLALSGSCIFLVSLYICIILLRDIPMVPFKTLYTDSQKVAEMVSLNQPVVLARNDCILVAGSGILNTFDRLEVAEFSARSLIDAGRGGQFVPIGDQEIKDLERAFSLS